MSHCRFNCPACPNVRVLKDSRTNSDTWQWVIRTIRTDSDGISDSISDTLIANTIGARIMAKSHRQNAQKLVKQAVHEIIESQMTVAEGASLLYGSAYELVRSSCGQAQALRWAESMAAAARELEETNETINEAMH